MFAPVSEQLYQERCAALSQIVRKYEPNLEAEKWIAQWVEVRHQRLCGTPSDFFHGEDGFSEVEYVLREDLEKLRAWSAASMIATHMNVPYGRIVDASDVVKCLLSGRFSAASKEAREILCAMFTECDKALIGRAARELQVPAETLAMLYQDSLRMGANAAPEWA